MSESTAVVVAPVVATDVAVAKPARARKPRAPKVQSAPIRKAVAEQPELLQSKAAQRPLKEDYSYLAEKAPTELHEEMAAWITSVTGVVVTAKQAQVVATLRHEFQRSETNQVALAAKRSAAAAKKAAAQKAKEAKERALLAELQAKFAAEAKN